MIFRGLLALAREIQQRAEDELYSEEAVHREMKEAYELLESGAITEEEFAAKEERFMQRLDEIMEHNRVYEGHDDDADDGDAYEETEEDGDVASYDSAYSYDDVEDEDGDERDDEPAGYRERPRHKPFDHAHGEQR